MTYHDWIEREGDRLAAEIRRRRFEQEMRGISAAEAKRIIESMKRKDSQND